MASMHRCLNTRTWITENILEVVITTRPCSTPTMRWRTEWRLVIAWPFFMTVSGMFFFNFSVLSFLKLYHISDQSITQLKKGRTPLPQNLSQPNQTCSVARWWTWPPGPATTSPILSTATSRTPGLWWRTGRTQITSTRGWDSPHTEAYSVNTWSTNKVNRNFYAIFSHNYYTLKSCSKSW